MKVLPIAIVLLVVLSFNSCITYNSMLNYQNEDETAVDSTLIKYISPPDIRIQADDVLSIKVFGLNSETVAPFNIVATQNADFNSLEAVQLSGYLVNKTGHIDFPVLGSIEVVGLTTVEVKERIHESLKDYLNDHVVSVRILNFRVTITGEVLRPGTFSVINERITIPDALALAGGMTPYANRNRILIIREEGNFLSINKIDFQSTEMFNSDHYFLKQNDVIYVEPLKAKVGAVTDQTNKVFPIISAFSTLVAIGIALFR